MAVTVNFSTPLIKSTEGEREIKLQSQTIEQMIGDLKAMFPLLIGTICDEKGSLKNNVAVYLNDTDIRFLDGIKTAIQDGNEVYIIPTIAGG